MTKHKSESFILRRIPVNRILMCEEKPNAGLLERQYILTEKWGATSPVTVRKTAAGYRLLRGQSTVMSARLCGIRRVPAMVVGGEVEHCELLSLVQAIGSQTDDCFETADRLEKLTESMGRERLSDELCIPDRVIDDYLRLLSLTDDDRAICRRAEIETAAVLRLAALAPSERERLLGKAAAGKASAIRTELLLKELSEDDSNRRFIVKDVRIFLNTIVKAVETMNRAGVNATVKRTDRAGSIEYAVRIPLKREKQSAPAPQSVTGRSNTEMQIPASADRLFIAE